MTARQSLELELAHLQREARTQLALSQQTTSMSDRTEHLAALRRAETRAAEIADLLAHLPVDAA